MPSAVSWRYDYGTEPWLRWLVRAGLAAVFGVYVGVLAMLAFVFLTVLVAGGVEARLFAILLALVGGPFSLLYLLPMLRDRTQRPTTFTGQERVIPLKEHVAVTVGGALVLGGALLVDPRLAGGLFVGGLAAGVAGVVFSTRGEIDPGTATAADRAREWDLSRVTDYSTRRIGPFVVVSFSASGPGSFGAVPSWILVPATVADDATAALQEIVATTDGDAGRDPNPAVRAVAVAFAVLLFGTGAAAVTQLDGPIGWWAATITGLFGVIFLAVAREG